MSWAVDGDKWSLSVTSSFQTGADQTQGTFSFPAATKKIGRRKKAQEDPYSVERKEPDDLKVS